MCMCWWIEKRHQETKGVCKTTSPDQVYLQISRCRIHHSSAGILKQPRKVQSRIWKRKKKARLSFKMVPRSINTARDYDPKHRTAQPDGAWKMDLNTRMEMAANLTHSRRPDVDTADSDLWIWKCIRAQTSEDTENEPSTEVQNHALADHVALTIWTSINTTWKDVNKQSSSVPGVSTQISVLLSQTCWQYVLMG